MIRLKQDGADYIESWEGCKLHIYKDVNGNDTIYIGHLVQPGETFNYTYEEGMAIFEKDIDGTEHAIARMVNVATNDDQYKALCDIVFNIGQGRFEHSRTLELINSGADKYTVADLIEQAFITSGGIVVPQLQQRRRADADLWRA